MKVIINIISIILLINLLQSCTKEFIPNLEDDEQKIVVNSLINNTSEIAISVTKPFLPATAIQVEGIADASVSIFEEDNFIADLIYSKEQGEVLGYFRSNFIPSIGVNYTIEVNHPDFDPASATASVPAGVEITDGSVQFLGGNKFNFNFTLNDPEEENYYYIKMFFQGFFIDPDSGDRIEAGPQRVEIPSESIPNGMQYLKNGYIFRDESFDGKVVNISGVARAGVIPNRFRDENEILTDPNIEPEDQPEIQLDSSLFYIHLQTLSEDTYKFYSTHANTLILDPEDFTETVTIYGNIENGFGIFSGIYVSEKAIEVEY